MNTQYLFQWKRRFVWRKLVVSGHSYEEKQDKMVLFFPDGGLREIKQWSDCELRLENDWVLATELAIKTEAGQ